MDHDPVLISTIAIGLTAAFVGGFVARKLRLPPIVGYLLAGVVIGPFTPGFVADRALATELAEIGVILLMFGVGIHFSIRDLLTVRSVAIPGALGQIVVATALGVGLGLMLGWSLGGALVLGLALSIASTVVLLRALMDRNELDTLQGRIAVGWSIVQDLVTVVVLVLLPAVAPLLGGEAPADGSQDSPLMAVALAVGKACLFAAIMIVVGARLVPWLLVAVAREGSRELFTLAVLAIALGVTFIASVVFGVSFALGAFLAGAVVGESDVSHQAAADALPLRDAFAVLFFVSVGMLVDPSFLVAHPFEILAVVGLVVIAKPAVSFAIVALLGYPARVGLVVSASLAHVGEFSFILATLGLSLGLLPPAGFQLIVAGSLISITLNPLLFGAIEPFEHWLRDHPRVRAGLERGGRALGRLPSDKAEPLRGHAILCGYGRVGQIIASALERRGFHYVVITLDRRAVEGLRERGMPAIYGDASLRGLLEEAGVEGARLVIVAVADMTAAQLIVERARELNPRIEAVVRTHSESEASRLRGVRPAVQTVYAERELAVQMSRYALRRFGISGPEAEAIAQGLRNMPGPPSGLPPARPSRRWTSRVRATVDRLRNRKTEPEAVDRASAGSRAADPRRP